MTNIDAKTFRLDPTDYPPMPEHQTPNFDARDRDNHPASLREGARVVAHRLVVRYDAAGNVVEEINVPGIVFRGIVKANLDCKKPDGTHTIFLGRDGEPDAILPTGDFVDHELIDASASDPSRYPLGPYACRFAFYPAYKVEPYVVPAQRAAS